MADHVLECGCTTSTTDHSKMLLIHSICGMCADHCTCGKLKSFDELADDLEKIKDQFAEIFKKTKETK